MAAADEFETEAPASGVGARLRQARLAAGLTLAEVAARTRVSERYLAAIEEGRFADLASRTYAIGFARAHARTVGLDEHEIAAEVRVEAERFGEIEKPRAATFEPGDPARVPSRKLAWAASLGAVVLATAVFVLWRSFIAPAVSLPDLQPEPAASTPASVAPAPVASASAQPATAGAVVFTATEPNIWVKFYDASGKQLLQKQLAQGESYTVPADAAGPKLWTGRADALQVTIGGKSVASVGTRPGKLKDVPVDAASLLARPAGAVLPSPPVLRPVPPPAPVPLPAAT